MSSVLEIRSQAVYWQTYNQFKGERALFGRIVSDLTIPIVLLKRFGIGVKFVESDDPAEFEKVIDEHTKGIYVESIGNPKYNVAPLPELAKVRQQHVVATLWSDVGTLRWRTIMVSR